MFRRRILRAGIALALGTMLCAGAELRAQSAPKYIPELKLPHSAQLTARAAGLSTLMDRLEVLKAQGPDANMWEVLLVRQQILQTVLSVSLQVDSTTGQIDEEIGQTRELQSLLETKRDQKLDLFNLLGIGIGGAGGTVSAVLGVNHEVASAWVGAVTGGVTTVASLVAYKKRHGGKAYLKVPSNMLAELFDGPSARDNVYPPAVVAFMSTPSPDDPDGMSRTKRLIQTWVDEKRIDPPESPKGKDKIAHVTSMPSENVQQTIDDLDDRQAMLYDFRARLTQMKLDLGALLSTLATPVTQPLTVPPPAP